MTPDVNTGKQNSDNEIKCSTCQNHQKNCSKSNPAVVFTPVLFSAYKDASVLSILEKSLLSQNCISLLDLFSVSHPQLQAILQSSLIVVCITNQKFTVV